MVHTTYSAVVGSIFINLSKDSICDGCASMSALLYGRGGMESIFVVQLLGILVRISVVGHGECEWEIEARNAICS